jgi:ribosomal protein S27E
MLKVTTRVSGKIDLELPIPCPGCGHESKVKARDAAPGTTITCQGCGATIELAGDDMRQAPRAMDEFVNAFKRIGR